MTIPRSMSLAEGVHMLMWKSIQLSLGSSGLPDADVMPQQPGMP